MYIQGTPEYEHHIKTYGPHKDFGYKDFIPLFTADKFNPEFWADTFAKAGAKYVVPVLNPPVKIENFRLIAVDDLAGTANPVFQKCHGLYEQRFPIHSRKRLHLCRLYAVSG